MWNVIEYGDFGSIVKEEYLYSSRAGHVTRDEEKWFCAEVTLKYAPYVDLKYFVSKRSAKSWCERMINKDVDKDAI